MLGVPIREAVTRVSNHQKGMLSASGYCGLFFHYPPLKCKYPLECWVMNVLKLGMRMNWITKGVGFVGKDTQTHTHTTIFCRLSNMQTVLCSHTLFHWIPTIILREGYSTHFIHRKLRLKEFKELANIWTQRYLILDSMLLIAMCLSPHN